MPKKNTKQKPLEQATPFKLLLPYPPSVNHYWRRVGARTLVSKAGRLYQASVARICQDQALQPLGCRLALTVLAFPPDNRRRDLDNVLKAILDSLKGKAYLDDDQVDCLGVERHRPTPGGAVLLDFRPVPNWEQMTLAETMALAGYPVAMAGPGAGVAGLT